MALQLFFKVHIKRTFVLMHVYVFQSLLNKKSATHSPQYLGSIIPAYVVMVIMAVVAFYTAGGSVANVKAALSCDRNSRQAVD